MAESTPDVQSTPGKKSRPMEDEEDVETTQQHTPDVHGAAMKIQRAKEAYKAYAGVEEKPSKGEVLGWNIYGMCSYFIHTVLIPILFPLIITQTLFSPPEPVQGWSKSHKGLLCRPKEMQLYEGLTYRSIEVKNLKFSPLEWTSISWVTGLILAGPILGFISKHLDHGQNHKLITAVAITIGALFCLPAGFFKTTWIFPPYIVFIVAANTVAAASHTRQLGLMVRGFTGPALGKGQFSRRKEVAGWLSLYATAAGCLGSAIISTFTYHMLRHSEKFVSLWVVSIFSGLKWLAGISHVFVSNRHGATTTSVSSFFAKSIFRYPHAVGSLAGVFLSSFSTMCIFTGGVLFLIGQLCLKPVHLLYILLTYFIFPMFALPLSYPLQQLIRADAVKMQLLGFLLSTATSGVGFYFRHKTWETLHVLVFTALQSTSVGLLHAFGRVLLLDCSPFGKEGSFSVWFSWVRALGTCTGFAVASVVPGDISRAFGIGFCTTIFGIVVLIFGNISNFGGAVDAGNIGEESEKGSPVHGLDTGIEMKRPIHEMEV